MIIESDLVNTGRIYLDSRFHLEQQGIRCIFRPILAVANILLHGFPENVSEAFEGLTWCRRPSLGLFRSV